MNFAPIVFFTYNRAEHARTAIESLLQNAEASLTHIYIYSDGAKGVNDIEGVIETRKYIHQISGFKTITIIERDKNWGLANNLIDGITFVVNRYGKVIVVEDDLIMSRYFLKYMNDALYFYENDTRISAVSAFSFPVKEKLHNTFFMKYFDCWGWGTWKRGWEIFNPDARELLMRINTPSLINDFNIGSSGRFYDMLKWQVEGRTNSWAIRFYASSFLSGKLILHTRESMTIQNGLDGSGSHCDNDSSFDSIQLCSSEIIIKKEKHIKESKRAYYAYRNFYFHKYQKDWKIKLKLKYPILGVLAETKHKCERLLRCSKIPLGGIIMLHHIETPNPNGIDSNQCLNFSPQSLISLIKYAKERNCEFISINELRKVLQNKERRRRLIVLTLDDGYIDNYINGQPVFNKYQVPFTIYISTKLIRKEMLVWWDVLEKLILTHELIVLNDNSKFKCSTKEEKENSFLQLRTIIMNLPPTNFEENFKNLFCKYQDVMDQYKVSSGMNWQQIKDISENPLCTIGNHTFSHPVSSQCDDKDLIKDILLADNEMKQHTRISSNHFAFPFGDNCSTSQHNIELIQALGFDTLCTTSEALICYGTNPHNLPRFFVSEKNWKQVIDRIADYC